MLKRTSKQKGEKRGCPLIALIVILGLKRAFPNLIPKLKYNIYFRCSTFKHTFYFNTKTMDYRINGKGNRILRSDISKNPTLI